MNRRMIPARVLLSLVIVAVLLPVTLCVVLGVAALLTQMGDTAGGVFLCRIALGGGILWVIDLISLVLALAIGSLGGPDEE
jgi:hypothetical protein